MRNPHIAARIFNTPLLIHPQKLDAIIAGLGPRLFEVSAADIRNLQDPTLQQLPAELFSTKKGEYNKERGYKVVDGVAVIGINGITVHRTRMEGPSSYLIGYNDITADIEHAMENSDVHAILRVYDSPGGESSGAFEHSDRLRDMRGKKPMIAIADSIAASAAYMAGTAADELVVSQTGYVGSIGVVMRHADLSRALANEGVNITHIYAGAHKIDGNPYAPLPEQVRADFQTEINSLYEMFIDTVVKNRNITAEAVRGTEARTYRGEEAVRVGLADRVSTTDALISELAAKRSTKSYSMPSSMAAPIQENAGLSGTQQDKTASPISTKGVTAMNLDELRAAHPDLCAALVDEGRNAGFEAGAAAERQRIQEVEAQSLAGHESLINTLKYDGKTTGAEAAMQVVNAEKKVNAQRNQEMIAGLPPAAPAAAAEDEAALKDANAVPKTEDEAKAKFEASADLQKEFTTFGTYWAYIKATTK